MPGTLTIAIVIFFSFPGELSTNKSQIMDSMDWFNPTGPEAAIQITALNRSLKIHGRVFLRSAGLRPWYVPVFERLGFVAKRVGARMPGKCMDRVNMYASTWIMTKAVDLASEPAASVLLEKLSI